MKIIRTLEDEIKTYNKLKLEDAKELYKEYLNCNNETQKKLYLDKLILETLYVPNTFIKRNNLKIFNNGEYDLEDIRSAYIECWIKRIKNGDLLRINSYSNIFIKSFFNEVYRNLVGEKGIIKEDKNIKTEELSDMFNEYIVLKNKGIKFTFNDLMTSLIKEKEFYKYFYPDIEKQDKLLIIFESMYNNLNFEKTNDLELSKQRVIDFIKLFLNNGLKTNLNNNIETDNIDETLGRIIDESFIKDVDSIIKNKRNRYIIHERFGIDNDKRKTLLELSKELNISLERIRQIEEKSLTLLSKSTKIRKYD